MGELEDIMKAKLEKRTYSLGTKKRLYNSKKFLILKKQSRENLIGEQILSAIKKLSGKGERR